MRLTVGPPLAATILVGHATLGHAPVGNARPSTERDADSMASAAPSRHSKWLAGIALPCRGDDVGRGATQSIIWQYAGPRFHVRVNIFDTNRTCLTSHPHVVVSHVPGYMTLFWKHVLVPKLTRHYDRIFILDNDVQLSTTLGFSLAGVDRWFSHTGAMVMQPSVISASRTTRPGTGVRAHGSFTADCVAYQVSAMERLHISRSEAYEVLWDILHSIPDERLSTDTALMSTWISLICERFPGRPSGILVQSMMAVHLDTHTIRKAGLDPYYNHPTHKKVNILFFMYEHPFYGEYVNGSARLRIQQRCGRAAHKPEDLGMASSRGRKPAHAKSTEGSVRCWSDPALFDHTPAAVIRSSERSSPQRMEQRIVRPGTRATSTASGLGLKRVKAKGAAS